ncbi:MAG TPA: hypothetical protein VKU84_03420 [Stellaceae bacterium]|nr:hypothetical protein [Stellaceae bacterium]
MTVSYTFGSSTTSIMNVLTAAALNQAASQESYRFNLVQNLLNKQFQQKIATLQANNDTSAKDNFLQVEISQLGQQKSLYNKLQSQYGQNANILSDITNQIVAMQNAASAGDSATFDGALATANADVSYLAVVQDNGTMQPDGVAQLQTSGLGLQSSASYDLSTPEGQAAALADLQNASNLISQVYAATTGNQTVAGSQASALGSQVNTLNGTLENDQFNNAASVTLQTLKLKTQLNTQVHLIQLNFANAQTAGANLQRQQLGLQATLEPPAPGTIFSIFG